MKQSLKYGLLTVMVLLLHSVKMNAAEVVELSAELAQEESFHSQACPVHGAFERFYIYCSAMPCEIGHADVSHIPADKSLIRYFARFREYKPTSDPFCDFLSHSYIYTFSDPVSYYVFGLRKIIV